MKYSKIATDVSKRRHGLTLLLRSIVVVIIIIVIIIKYISVAYHTTNAGALLLASETVKRRSKTNLNKNDALLSLNVFK